MYNVIYSRFLLHLACDPHVALVQEAEVYVPPIRSGQSSE